MFVVIKTKEKRHFVCSSYANFQKFRLKVMGRWRRVLTVVARTECGQHPTKKLLHTLLSLNFMAYSGSPKTKMKFVQLDLKIVVVVNFHCEFLTISCGSHELVEHSPHLIMSRHPGAHFSTVLRCSRRL